MVANPSDNIRWLCYVGHSRNFLNSLNYLILKLLNNVRNLAKETKNLLYEKF